MKFKDKLRLKEFGLDYDKPQDFVTLQFQRDRPLVYLIWSSVWLIYHMIFVCIHGYWYSQKKDVTGSWLSFLTNWSYLLLTLQAFVDFLITCYTTFINDKLLHGNDGKMPWYVKSSWLLLNAGMSSAVAITLTYWSMLAKSVKFTTLNKHGLNSLYILLVVTVTSKPVKFQHFYQPMIFNAAYIIYSVIHQAAGGNVLYSFLDWSNKLGKSITLSIVYVFIAVPIVHLLVFGIYCLKVYIVRKLQSEETPREEKDGAHFDMLPHTTAPKENKTEKNGDLNNHSKNEQTQSNGISCV